MMRTVCLVANKKQMDESGKFNKGILAVMWFFGNAEALCQHYVDEEREKVRLEKERIWKERERIEWERKEAEMKRLEEEKKARG